MYLRFKVMHSVIRDIKAVLRHDEYSYRLVKTGATSPTIYVDYIKEAGRVSLSITKNH